MHLSPDSRKLLNGGVDIFTCDGITEVVVPSFDVWDAMMEDPYYESVIAPDEKTFVDGKKMVVGVGT